MNVGEFINKKTILETVVFYWTQIDQPLRKRLKNGKTFPKNYQQKDHLKCITSHICHYINILSKQGHLGMWVRSHINIIWLLLLMLYVTWRLWALQHSTMLLGIAAIMHFYWYLHTSSHFTWNFYQIVCCTSCTEFNYWWGAMAR